MDFEIIDFERCDEQALARYSQPISAIFKCVAVGLPTIGQTSRSLARHSRQGVRHAVMMLRLTVRHDGRWPWRDTRALLKCLVRSFGFVCVDVRPVDARGNVP